MGKKSKRWLVDRVKIHCGAHIGRVGSLPVALGWLSSACTITDLQPAAMITASYHDDVFICHYYFCFSCVLINCRKTRRSNLTESNKLLTWELSPSNVFSSPKSAPNQHIVSSAFVACLPYCKWLHYHVTCSVIRRNTAQYSQAASYTEMKQWVRNRYAGLLMSQYWYRYQ